MFKVILVCTGNTCRSPMAEFILKDIAESSGTELAVSSAGLAVGASTSINSKSAEILSQKYNNKTHINKFIKDHTSMQLDQSMILDADEILTMTIDQANYVLELFPESAGKVKHLGLYRAHLPEPWKSRADVVDPFGNTLDVYNETYAHLKLLLEAWFDDHQQR